MEKEWIQNFNGILTSSKEREKDFTQYFEIETQPSLQKWKLETQRWIKYSKKMNTKPYSQTKSKWTNIFFLVKH